MDDEEGSSQKDLSRAQVSNSFHKGPCGCRLLFQPSRRTPDLTGLINWSQSSDSWLVKLSLGWSEQKPAATQAPLEYLEVRDVECVDQ